MEVLIGEEVLRGKDREDLRGQSVSQPGIFLLYVAAARPLELMSDLCTVIL